MLKLNIGKRREFNVLMDLAFIDITKAFDNVKHSLLWSIMEKRGVPTQLISMLKRLYYEQLILDLTGRIMKNIPINKGVRQGCPISL